MAGSGTADAIALSPVQSSVTPYASPPGLRSEPDGGFDAAAALFVLRR